MSTAPYNILIIILNYLDENATDSSEVYDRFFYYQDILTVVVALNPTLNFILYFLSGSKFRKDVKLLDRVAFSETHQVVEQNYGKKSLS